MAGPNTNPIISETSKISDLVKTSENYQDPNQYKAYLALSSELASLEKDPATLKAVAARFNQSGDKAQFALDDQGNPTELLIPDWSPLAVFAGNQSNQIDSLVSSIKNGDTAQAAKMAKTLSDETANVKIPSEAQDEQSRMDQVRARVDADLAAQNSDLRLGTVGDDNLLSVYKSDGQGGADVYEISKKGTALTHSFLGYWF